MLLSSEYQEYHLPQEGTYPLGYFCEYPAKLWGFEHYVEHHGGAEHLSKSALKAIFHRYHEDMNGISKIKRLPTQITDYIEHLRKQKYTKKLFFKGSNSKLHQPISITGSNANVVIAKNYYSGPEKQAGKRKLDYGDRTNDMANTDDLFDDSIWEICLGFIENGNKKKFHQHSPANHGIVQCGHGISPRPSWPEDIYRKLLDNHVSATFPIPGQCTTYIDNVIDCTTLKDMKKFVKESPAFDEDTEEFKATDFLEDLFHAAYIMYKERHDLTDGESAFDVAFIYPFLNIIAAANTYGCAFVPGETCLKSMTKQLVSLGKHKDDRYQYKADGVLRLLERKDLEILLLETSNEFGCKDKTKISFDHHKGSFGAVAMLKSIADRYPYASTTQFGKIKVFFLHAAGNKLHLWSLSFKQNGIYELWRELHLTIVPSFNDKADFMPDFLRFFWSMNQLIRQTIDGIYQLCESHTSIKAEFRYSTTSPPLLTDVITPSIIKLTQQENSKGMADLGPFYSPLQSPTSSPVTIPGSPENDRSL